MKAIIAVCQNHFQDLMICVAKLKKSGREMQFSRKNNNNDNTLIKVGRYPLTAAKLKCLSWICLCFLPCDEFIYVMLPLPNSGLNNKNWLTKEEKEGCSIIQFLIALQNKNFGECWKHSL